MAGGQKGKGNIVSKIIVPPGDDLRPGRRMEIEYSGEELKLKMKNFSKHQYIEIIVPPGAKIPNIESYGSLLLPFAIQDDYCRINNIGCVASENDDDFCVVQTDDHHFSLLPGPEFSPRLYRGQTRFHDQCVPSLFRLKENRIGYLTALLKKYEFYKLIAGSHPIIGYLQNWTIDGKYFKIDMEGLSQHYEFATSMIDVTRSKDIAMFFALCEKNATSKWYEPIIDENREVVLYTVNLKALLENNYPNFHIIGFQALPRPDAQKAYSLFIGDKDNFNIVPFVSYERFKVKRKQSEKYFQMFDEGNRLFPKDDIVTNIAQEIRESKEIDREVVETCYQRHWIPKIWANTSELVKFLNTFGYGVTEKHLEFSAEQKRTIIEKWNSNPPLNSTRVKCRFVYEPL